MFYENNCNKISNCTFQKATLHTILYIYKYKKRILFDFHRKSVKINGWLVRMVKRCILYINGPVMRAFGFFPLATKVGGHLYRSVPMVTIGHRAIEEYDSNGYRWPPVGHHWWPMVVSAAEGRSPNARNYLSNGNCVPARLPLSWGILYCVCSWTGWSFSRFSSPT